MGWYVMLLTERWAVRKQPIEFILNLVETVSTTSEVREWVMIRQSVAMFCMALSPPARQAVRIGFYVNSDHFLICVYIYCQTCNKISLLERQTWTLMARLAASRGMEGDIGSSLFTVGLDFSLLYMTSLCWGSPVSILAMDVALLLFLLSDVNTRGAGESRFLLR